MSNNLKSCIFQLWIKKLKKTQRLFLMKLIFYLFIIFQTVILFKVQANKLIVELLSDKSLKWEKYSDQKEKINRIIWKSYQNDETYFEKKLNTNNTNLINNNETKNIAEKYFSNNVKYIER